MTQDRALYLSEGHRIDRDVERRRSSDGEWEPAVGCVDGAAYLALTANGEPIAGTEIPATEYADRPAAYFAEWSPAELVAAGIDTLEGRAVYPILSIPSINYREAEEVLVRAVRVI